MTEETKEVLRRSIRKGDVRKMMESFFEYHNITNGLKECFDKSFKDCETSLWFEYDIIEVIGSIVDGYIFPKFFGGMIRNKYFESFSDEEIGSAVFFAFQIERTIHDRF